MYVAYEVGLFSICWTEMGLKDFSFTEHAFPTFFKFFILNRIFRHVYKLKECLKVILCGKKMENILVLRKAAFATHSLSKISCTDDMKYKFTNAVFALTHLFFTYFFQFR